ncbi:MAG TPA: hypothetical protein VNV35_06005 [Puia sp.]|jgi:hypothetical protein|nr:hypothetical protein [Puia sp.]
MSITFDVVINPVILLGAVIAGGVFGYLIFKISLNKSKARIQQLEKELMTCNEETLEAQRAYVLLESRLKDQQETIPVIPLKINGKESSKEKASK